MAVPYNKLVNDIHADNSVISEFVHLVAGDGVQEWRWNTSPFDAEGYAKESPIIGISALGMDTFARQYTMQLDISDPLRTYYNALAPAIYKVRVTRTLVAGNVSNTAITVASGITLFDGRGESIQHNGQRRTTSVKFVPRYAIHRGARPRVAAPAHQRHISPTDDALDLIKETDMQRDLVV